MLSSLWGRGRGVGSSSSSSSSPWSRSSPPSLSISPVMLTTSPSPSSPPPSQPPLHEHHLALSLGSQCEYHPRVADGAAEAQNKSVVELGFEPSLSGQSQHLYPTKDNMTAATDAHGMPLSGHAGLCLKPPALLPLPHPCMSPGDRCPLASCCGTLTSVGSGSKSHPVCGFYSQDPEVREDEGLPAVPHRGKHSGTLWTKGGDTGNVSPGDMAALKARTG